MKLNEFTSGAISAVAQPMGQVQRRVPKKKKKVEEMDKGSPQPGRDGHVSHSTYGTRDRNEPWTPSPVKLDIPLRRHMLKKLAWETDWELSDLELLKDKELADLYHEKIADARDFYNDLKDNADKVLGPKTLKSTMESIEQHKSWEDYGMPTAEEPKKKPERRLHSWFQHWEEQDKKKKEQAEKPVGEDAEPIDREFSLVKKLGRLGSFIVQNTKLWEKYSDAVDNNDVDWIIGLIQDKVGADKEEVLHLAELFGEIGGGLGRLTDFAWAVKEGRWEEDFMNPYREHRKKGVAEGTLASLFGKKDDQYKPKGPELVIYVKHADGTKTYANVKDAQHLADLQKKYRNEKTQVLDFSRQDVLDWLESRGVSLSKFWPGAEITVGNRGLAEFTSAGGGGNRMGGGRKTGGGGDDDSGEDPYKYPEPKHYSRSIDFFGRFEADHFDDEVFDQATGEFRGYWDDEQGRDQIAYFKFDSPKQTGDDDPGMGWYYEPQNESINEFAPDSSGDGGEEDTLHKYARMWYNGDLETQQQVEQILDRMGWEIGELESEEGGAFVVRSGDENGDSYIGFAPEDLIEGLEETKQRLDPKCWKGYRKQGTKIKGGVRVNNCVPESANTINEDISGVNDLIKQGVKLIDLPIYTFVGRDVKTGQTSKIVDLDSRPVVLIDIKGLHMPFYCSTGEGGKKNVPAGKWYPYFGNGQGGWFNKTSEEQINSFYGSSVLKSYAELLNNTIGNVVGAKLPELDIGKGKPIINRDMLSPQNSSELDKDDPNRVENWKRYKQRINTILKKIGSEPLFKDVTGEPELPKKPDAKPTPASPSTPMPAGGLIKNQLVLTHNGKTVTTMNISAPIGKQILKSLGDDSKFWDDDQFKIEKNKDGTWSLIPNLSAPNKTMINGVAVNSATQLKQGMTISVGNPVKKIEKLPLTVKQGVAEASSPAQQAAIAIAKKKKKELKEAPIELDTNEPRNPMIYGHNKANPAKLQYRMMRAASQFRDLAERVNRAQEADSLPMWQSIVANFSELAMNVDQIGHALEELEKTRRKGGKNSRGIPDLS